jgi:hypothetical protein
MATKPAKKTARGAAKSKTEPSTSEEPPFNEETLKVLRDADEGKNLLRYPSAEAMYEDLGMRKRGEA